MANDITKLLNEWSESGNRAVLDELFPVVYNALKRIATNRLKNENANHTLQPTELAHQAYIGLVDQRVAGFNNRAQFFALASKMMRNILVDHAKAKNAKKRGGDFDKISSEVTIVGIPEMDLDILALDEALSDLAKIDERKSRIVELKFFGGLTTKEISEVVESSVSTIEREWSFSRAWLHKKLKKNDEE